MVISMFLFIDRYVVQGILDIRRLRPAPSGGNFCRGQGFMSQPRLQPILRYSVGQHVASKTGAKGWVPTRLPRVIALALSAPARAWRTHWYAACRETPMIGPSTPGNTLRCRAFPAAPDGPVPRGPSLPSQDGPAIRPTERPPNSRSARSASITCCVPP